MAIEGGGGGRCGDPMIVAVRPAAEARRVGGAGTRWASAAAAAARPRVVDEATEIQSSPRRDEEERREDEEIVGLVGRKLEHVNWPWVRTSATRAHAAVIPYVYAR